jgi:hypothetical protein
LHDILGLPYGEVSRVSMADDPDAVAAMIMKSAHVPSCPAGMRHEPRLST